MRFHLGASDAETMSLTELLRLAEPEEHEAWDKLTLGFTDTWGAADLRRVIAATYAGLAEEHILCFAGADEGIYCAMLALLGPDDHAIVTVPNYQPMESVPVSICGSVSGVALRAENGWALDLDELRGALRPNTRLIAVNFPNNPTGAVASRETFEGIVALCAERGIHLFNDEVFRGLERDSAQQLPQVAEVYEKGVSLNVLSKAYGLAGLRIGWIASRDRALLARMEGMKNYLSTCNSAPSEVLARIALKAREPILGKNRDLCAGNLVHLRRFFDSCPDLYEWSEPDGGCVGFALYKGSDGVEEHCRKLLRQSGVLLVPSPVFHSELLPVPGDRFRVGFGHRNFEAGLNAWRGYLRG
jgi:aspartate/methionine/tyrosine aminotransferase